MIDERLVWNELCVCGCGCGTRVATPPACRSAAPPCRAPGSKPLLSAFLRVLPRARRINVLSSEDFSVRPSAVRLTVDSLPKCLWAFFLSSFLRLVRLFALGPSFPVTRSCRRGAHHSTLRLRLSLEPAHPPPLPPASLVYVCPQAIAPSVINAATSIIVISPSTDTLASTHWFHASLH